MSVKRASMPIVPSVQSHTPLSCLFLLLEHNISDALMHLAQFLTTDSLVLLSMVNRQLKTLSDTTWSNKFANTISFTLKDYLFQSVHDYKIQYNETKAQLEAYYAVQNMYEMWKLCTYSNLRAGGTLNMKLGFNIPWQYVSFLKRSGEGEQVLPLPAKFQHDKQTFSIVFNVWKIRDRCFRDAEFSHASNSNTRAVSVGLMATSLQCRMSSIPQECFDAWKISAPFVTIKVPLLLRLDVNPSFLETLFNWDDFGNKILRHNPFQTTAYELLMRRVMSGSMRVRAVHRSIKVCTCCNQRTSCYQSLETHDKALYHLCRMCWDMHYVTNSKLITTYKLRVTANVAQRLQTVTQVLFREMRASESPCLLMAYEKESVAHALGHESWIQFIRRNHYTPQKYSQFKNKGIYRYHWRRSAFVH